MRRRDVAIFNYFSWTQSYTLLTLHFPLLSMSLVFNLSLISNHAKNLIRIIHLLFKMRAQIGLAF
jgi:hypothetical protein